jgi:DNA polymerase-3 subunit delta'
MASDDDLDTGDELEAAGPAYEVPALLPWQAAPLRALLAQAERRHHGTVLHAPAGSGSRRYALHLAQGMLCRAPAAGLACGTCAACHLFLTAGHPDFRLVERQIYRTKSGEERLRDEIVIGQVRALIENFIYLSSHLQGVKVVLFYLAEEMNRNTANALLKSLEEPPQATYFILVSHRPRLLLPTVVSRCRLVPTPRPDAGAAAAWLGAAGATDPVSLLAHAGGAPLKALAMGDPAYQADRARFLERLAEPRRLSVVALGAELDAGARAQKKARLAEWFDLLLTWTFDLAACAQGQPPRYHGDFAPALARLGAEVAPRRILRYHRSLLRDRALLSHPLNPRLVAEQALFGYRQAVLGD